MTKLKVSPWLIVLLIVAALFAILWNPLSALIGTVFGGLNAGLKKGAGFLGLSPAVDAQITAIESGPADTNCWNAGYCTAHTVTGDTLFSVADAATLMAYIKSTCQTVTGGVDDSSYAGVFACFISKCHFSDFCAKWLAANGTPLANWMLNGWLGGAVASMGNTDLLSYDAVIQALPVNCSLTYTMPAGLTQTSTSGQTSSGDATGTTVSSSLIQDLTMW